jgi:hypothetical protein
MNTVDRRSFIAGSLGILGGLALGATARAAQSTPDASKNLPALQITLKDDGFEVPQSLGAGRYAVTAVNYGTSTTSHFGLGRIPDHITDAEYDEWLNSDGDTEALSFEDVIFAGVPDWPQPGKSVTGVIDLAPGRYFIFDPFETRGITKLVVDERTAAGSPDPQADVMVELREMEISMPDSAFTSDPRRWRIANNGSFIHEVAVLPVSAEFTEEHLHILLSLPEDATPPPGVPEFEYQPAAAIGLLSPGQTSWLDAQLAPGRYLAVCMIPFGTGSIHAAEGMYLFFDVPRK